LLRREILGLMQQPADGSRYYFKRNLRKDAPFCPGWNALAERMRIEKCALRASDEL
jgi:hypothetical protein